MPIGSLRVLRHREFTIVWTAVLLSDLGTWMQIAALGLYAVEATGHAKWVGILTTVTYLSGGLFSPLGGVAADRHDRRRVIALAVSLQAAIALLLWGLFSAGQHSLLLLAVLAAVQGALASYVNPAREAMIPDIVPPHDVPSAASLIHVSWNAGRALGPLLAVAMLSVTSYGGIFLLNGISFLFIAGAVMTVRARAHLHAEGGSTAQRLRTGVEALRSSRACRAPVVIVVAEMVLAAPFIAFIPVMGQLVLGGGRADTAHLFAAQGAGSAVGVLAIASLVPRFGQERVVLASLFAEGVLGVTYALSTSITMAILVILPLSAAHTSIFAGSTALLQRDAPRASRGRIIAIYLALTNAGYAVSSMLQAPVADHVGLRAVLAAGSAALIVVAAAVVRAYGVRGFGHGEAPSHGVARV